MKRFNDVNYYADMIRAGLVFEDKDLICFELCDPGCELRAEWVEAWAEEGRPWKMYIGYESQRHGNMAYRELDAYPTEIEISMAVAEVLTEGKANFDYWEKEEPNEAY